MLRLKLESSIPLVHASLVGSQWLRNYHSIPIILSGLEPILLYDLFLLGIILSNASLVAVNAESSETDYSNDRNVRLTTFVTNFRI